jgi:hypothetical protein
VYTKVLLRSEYKDEPVKLDPEEVEYLENPPEKKWTEMTAKDAVEALMVKDPTNPILKSLKKSGKLQEILYADSDGGNDRRGDSYSRSRAYAEDSQGREGGARVRSIGVPAAAVPSAARKEWKPKESFRDMSDWSLPRGAEAPADGNSGNNSWNKKTTSQPKGRPVPVGVPQRSTEEFDSSMDDWLNDLLGASTSSSVIATDSSSIGPSAAGGGGNKRSPSTRSDTDADYERCEYMSHYQINISSS